MWNLDGAIWLFSTILLSAQLTTSSPTRSDQLSSISASSSSASSVHTEDYDSAVGSWSISTGSLILEQVQCHAPLPYWPNPLGIEKPGQKPWITIKDYADLTQLCAVHGNQIANMKVRCDYASVEPSVMIIPDDPLDVMFFSKARRLMTYCLDHCKCIHDDKHWMSGSDDDELTRVCKDDLAKCHISLDGYQVPKLDLSKALAFQQAQCGGSCSSASDCDAPPNRARDCGCVAKPVKEQGQRKWKAFCLTGLGIAAGAAVSGLGGKRSVPEMTTACPCNATYVSTGCCGSDTGVVWEAPGLNLGELVLEEE